MCEARWCCFSVLTRVMWTYKCDVISDLGQNSKELLSSTISAEASFDDNSYKEVNVNKILSAIIEKNWNISYQILSAQF